MVMRALLDRWVRGGGVPGVVVPGGGAYPGAYPWYGSGPSPHPCFTVFSGEMTKMSEFHENPEN